MSTLPWVELGVLGPVQVRQGGAPVIIPGAKPRAILTMLGLHGGSVVSANTLVELLWGEDPPRTAAKALQTHISALRRVLGDGFVLTEGAGWSLADSEVDASRYKSAARLGREAAAAGDTSQAVSRFEEALALWRGIPELPDGRRGASEKTRWIEGHAALVEDRADALLTTGRAAEIIGELEAAVADAPLRERRWGQLMLALYRAGRQGEALGAYQRARALLADELGVDPGPELRRLEAAIVAQDIALEIPAAQQPPVMTRAVTFLLTDIEGSTAAWEADADAMAGALARHDELVEQVVTSRGGRLIKTRGEGDATFSVFERPSAAAAAAIELQEAIVDEPWALREPMRIRVALHTGEAELRDGDYFGRAVNRAARLRSLAAGGQILCSGATAELVIDSLPDDVVLADLGMRELRNLARPEHVFELRLETAEEHRQAISTDAPLQRPSLPAVLAGPGPFVGRGRELERLFSAWQTALAGGTNAVLIAGEPGVGKTRLAGEWSRQAYDQGALVIYGRCDEDLGAPYQPFAEALRSLVPCMGSRALRALRGVEALLPLVPGLTDILPDLATPTRADPDTERYALFDAVVALLGIASASAPVVLILDDLHWAAKPTLLLLRHLLRFGEQARVQIVGTYRSTDLDRSHPLAAMLADLHRDGTANRLQLGGLDEDDVTAYVAEAGYNDEELARALASVTGGNPFFLIEALRHVDESGGRWDQSTLPQGVREAVSRRLSRLLPETNKALAAAAVVGSRFALELVERVVGDDLVDAFDEACKAGIVIEEPGGRYRFNHAIVRQSLLAELPSVRRMRLHQRIATTLENEPGADDELLAELAHHYFECAWAGNAAKAVEYCRRAADQAMTRLAYEGAADLYDRALHALEEIDDELPDRDDQVTELLIARCEALLAAGDVASAAGAVSELQGATVDSARLTAWATCFDGQLSMLSHPERLDEVEAAVSAAADKLAELDDAAGEAKAHTVRAGCLARLGRIGDCEIALDDALTAARRAREHRRVNAVLANAPLAALWGPNPVPRAGGRCLDVVRLLRITTDSPAVEATSTRCQAVLEAFRGRDAAARRMIDTARRTVTELGLRHAFLEVEQFAGIVELIMDESGAAEPHLRKAYNGFRRMGLDADTAETAALLGRACLALDRDAEADELCTESERLAGHALKPSIAWRTLRAQLLSRGNDHGAARRVAEEAVNVAERTDLLVDHGDACLALATVLGAAGDVAGVRAAAERAVDLYERKGAAALAEKAQRILGEPAVPPIPTSPEAHVVELDNACVRVIGHLDDAVDREAWGEVEQQFASDVRVESRRKIVGYPRVDLSPRGWIHEVQRARALGMVRQRHAVVAVRGDRLALTRLEVGTADVSPGAAQDEMLRLIGLDEDSRIALLLWFDIGDLDAAMAELDAVHARFGEVLPRVPLENGASRAEDRLNALAADKRWNEFSALFADDIRIEDRRRGFRSEGNGRATVLAEARAIADLGVENATSQVLAIRGDRLALVRIVFWGQGEKPEAYQTELLRVAEIDADNRIAAHIVFDPDDFEAALTELDARYLAGEAPAHGNVLQPVMDTVRELNRHEPGPMLGQLAFADHRRVPFGSGEDYGRAIEELWTLVPDARYWTKVVQALDAHGLVSTLVIEGTDAHGNELQWDRTFLFLSDGPRVEVYEADDVDAALARFEALRPQTRRIENAASEAVERYFAHFEAHDWVALARVLADDISIDDRRRVVNAGIQRGRDAEIANLQAAADAGFTHMTSVVIAARGGRLILTRASGRDDASEEFLSDALGVAEINSDNQIAAIVIFDLDDFDAAIAELDARYLAGEAAAHARTWSVITQSYAAQARREFPAMTPDCVTIDHRRAKAFAPGEMTAYIRAGWDLDQTIRTHVEVVHRLSDLGAVCTYAGHGVSHEGFDAEWREIAVTTVDGDMVNRCELFDEADIDAAIARFEQLSRPTPQLENAASQITERLQAHFAARDWTTMTEMLADDVLSDDRRRVVNAGIRRGRDAAIRDAHANADLGVYTSTVIATRGERLVLRRARYSREAFHTDILTVFEINDDDRVVARVVFDPDDFDAAITELDARYLAGEGARDARTWSVIAGTCAVFNQHELPATTPDSVYVDHRPVLTVNAVDLPAYLRGVWDLTPDIRIYIEAVHRLSGVGAVVTHAVNGTSPEGFNAEWRMMCILTVEGDRLSRCEVFDETDLDAALVRFEELSPKTRRLENAASQAYRRFRRYFAARDWAAMAELLTADTSVDDHRRVVNAEIRRGRDVEIANMQAFAEIGAKRSTATVIATRGERLVLCRTRISSEDEQPGAFNIEFLNVVEITADKRIAARSAFDLDDFDAAIAELDARYLAGEATSHAHMWSVVLRNFAAFNGHELPSTTPDWVNVDHRRARAFSPGDLIPYIHATWEIAPQARIYVEAVHRLTNLGVVVTQATRGTSPDGFDAEWLEVNLLTVDGDLINRCEVYDEEDIDAAIARFDQLSPPAPRLENAATKVTERFFAHFAVRDWDAMAELLAEGISTDDRRRVLNAGIRRGRDAEIANWRATDDIWSSHVRSTVATRGERLALYRFVFTGKDQPPEAFSAAALAVIEINDDNRIAEIVVFDLDGLDAAFEELDARYLAGEAAPYRRTWSVIAAGYASLNRRELPATTTDFANIDHRRGAAFAPGELIEYLRAGWDLDQDVKPNIEAVHRLSDLGAVITHTAYGTSREGFDAEWREVTLFTVDGDAVSRCELFDEADLDAALARFDQLSRPAPRLENAASQIADRVMARFTAREWDAAAEMLADDWSSDDRRRTVNAGIQRGRDAAMKDAHANADVGAKEVTSTVIATRGERLVLRRARYSSSARRPEGFYVDALSIYEINADRRVAAAVTFDVEDIDAAFEELEARYLAGEAAPYSQTWSVISRAYATLNQHELFATTPDWVNVDHRRPTIIEEGGLNASLLSLWKLVPDIRFRVEAVHRLSSLGAVCSHVAHGVSQDGFDAEWRGIEVMTVDGDLVNRCEIFDEADLDAAIARFEELHRQGRRLENAASRVYEHFWTCFAARDWVAMAEIFADDSSTDDRRRVVNAGIRQGRDAVMADMRAVAEVGTADNITSTVLATRGERLTLNRIHSWALQTQLLNVVELNADERTIASVVVFDADDFDTAIAELDARYVAGEAAAHAHTWSVIAGECAAFNRHERTAVGYIIIDHRPLAIIDAADPQAATRAVWEVTPDFSIHIEVMHRLCDFAAVATYMAQGTSPEGFDAEWRMIQLLTVEGDGINRCEVFDEADLDTALARFEELQPQARRLANTASQIIERYLAHFAARDWAAFAELLADDIVADDRRRVVNAGIRRGRDVHIADNRVIVEVSAPTVSSSVIATRGDRLALAHVRIFNRGMSGEVGAEVLGIAEIDSDERIVAVVTFDPDDIDAALAELDARYLAGEAAPHAHTWSLVTRAYAAFNSREFPSTTPDSVYIDHRPLQTLGAVDLVTATRSIWDIAPDLRLCIEAVHRLGEVGAVVTQTLTGTSREGFDAEWPTIDIFVFEGDLLSRCEVFDEADLDVALARFEELQPQTPRLENAASQIGERYLALFAAADWDGMAEMLADDFFRDDRRRVVGAGIRHGRDTWLEDMRSTADLWSANVTMNVIATRGVRLVLTRGRFSHRGQAPEAFLTELLSLVEINADERIAALVMFDPDDIDAALAELDARYLAGEAATYAPTWSVIMQACAALNRREIFATAADFVDIDHRSLAAIRSGDLKAYIREALDDGVYEVHIEAVHRLSDLGAVVTLVSSGTSQEGFDGEWRMADIFTVEGDLINRAEIFDEADLVTALARFDELQPQARHLENAASQAVARLWTCFADRDWAAMAEMMTDDYFTHDHRRVVNAGVLRGRDVHVANMRAVDEVGFEGIASTVIATRGQRLVLSRVWSSARGFEPGEFSVKMLGIVEIDDDNRLTASALFDGEDIEAAFEELDARYLAGEAAAYAHTWSLISDGHARFNRQELPVTTADPVYIDHRPVVSIDGGDLATSVRAVWDVTPAASVYIEAVHRLDELGAVATQVVKGTSQEGFDAEWRTISIFTFEGDLLSHYEVFDEADLDAALARFDELDRPAPLLENAATRMWERLADAFNRRDVDGFLAPISADGLVDDRRRGLRASHKGTERQKAAHALFELPESWRMEIAPLAIRGQHLSLIRQSYRDTEDSDRPITAELLIVSEVSDDGLGHDFVNFDPEEIDAALAELDARYLAGEAAAHAHTWSVIVRIYEAFNRHELYPTTPNWANADHRRGIAFAPGEMTAYLRAGRDLTPDTPIYIETVHRLSDLGVVVTQVMNGTSRDGFDAEWREIGILTVEGDLINRCEMFDETDLDAALARFDELNRPPPLLENASTRLWTRVAEAVNRRDVDGLLALGSADHRFEDRRKGLRDGFEGLAPGRKALRAMFETVPSSWRLEVEPIAIRGSRLSLVRECYRDIDDADRPIVVELLQIAEVGDDDLMHDLITFDPDDINGAFAELTARWIASGEVAHPEVIEAMCRLNEIANRHDWDTYAALSTGAAFVSHRQLSSPDIQTIADHMSSNRMMASLVPDYWADWAEVLTHSAMGAVNHMVVRGTSTDGLAIEIPFVALILVDGDRVTRFEAFDPDQRDLALARFDELNVESQPQ